MFIVRATVLVITIAQLSAASYADQPPPPSFATETLTDATSKRTTETKVDVSVRPPTETKADATPPLPRAVAIQINTVRISPTRRDGRPWRTLDGNRPDVCKLGQFAKPGVGDALETACQLLTGQTEERTKHSSTYPDLYVRLKTSGPTTYRTYTVPMRTEHDFGAQFVIPTEKVPSTLAIQVFDNDGAPSNEQIGEVLIDRQRLLTATRDGGATLVLSDGAVEKVVIDVSLPIDKTLFIESCRGWDATNALDTDAEGWLCQALKRKLRKALRGAGYFVLSAPWTGAYLGRITCERKSTDGKLGYNLGLNLTAPDGRNLIPSTAEWKDVQDLDVFIEQASTQVAERLGKRFAQ